MCRFMAEAWTRETRVACATARIHVLRKHWARLQTPPQVHTLEKTGRLLESTNGFVERAMHQAAANGAEAAGAWIKP